MRCMFCAHRAKEAADTPLGLACVRCVKRIAAMAHRAEGDVAERCWGAPKAVRSMLRRIIEEEAVSLGTMPPSSVAAAEANLEARRLTDVRRRLASTLAHAPKGPDAERALALLLGPMLKPGGADALRAALFSS